MSDVAAIEDTRKECSTLHGDGSKDTLLEIRKIRKEYTIQGPRQAAAEAEHSVIRGSAKSIEILKERIRHARKDSNNICTRMSEHNIFSEHHQDPPADLENYSYDEQGGLGEDNT